jgi:hypothetical protein
VAAVRCSSGSLVEAPRRASDPARDGEMFDDGVNVQAKAWTYPRGNGVGWHTFEVAPFRDDCEGYVLGPGSEVRCTLRAVTMLPALANRRSFDSAALRSG